VRALLDYLSRRPELLARHKAVFLACLCDKVRLRAPLLPHARRRLPGPELTPRRGAAGPGGQAAAARGGCGRVRRAARDGVA